MRLLWAYLLCYLKLQRPTAQFANPFEEGHLLLAPDYVTPGGEISHFKMVLRSSLTFVASITLMLNFNGHCSVFEISIRAKACTSFLQNLIFYDGSRCRMLLQDDSLHRLSHATSFAQPFFVKGTPWLQPKCRLQPKCKFIWFICQSPSTTRSQPSALWRIRWDRGWRWVE